MYPMDPNTRKIDVGLGKRVAAIAAVAAVVLTAGGLVASQPLTVRASGYDWLQFDGNAQHSGNNTMETMITPANVGTLTRLFQVTLPAVADGPPAYLSGVATANGTQDLLFLTTKDGQILARDAHTGAQLWSHQYGPNGCKINNGSSDCYTTSEPAIDPNRQFVYSYGLDGKVHKYAVGNGNEVMTGGWPETTTLKDFDEKGSSDLAIATAGSGTNTTPYLYVANGGYPGDNGDYQGHVTTINLNTDAQNVFNANCSNNAVHFVEKPGTPDCPAVQSAIWARAGVTYDAQTDRVYMSTGNGDFKPANHDWGDTLFALSPDGTGQNGNPLLTYTPADYQSLQNGDADLGSTAPVILPPLAGSSVSHLGLQSDKAAKLRLLNLDTLSGGTGNTAGEIAITGVPQGGEVLTQPAVWTNPADGSTWTFVANDQGLSALKVTLGSGGQPSLSTVWKNTSGGTSPIIANNVLYYVGDSGLQALDPTTGNQLWADKSINNVHWDSPIVANGVLYVTDNSNNGRLTAYTLPASATSTPTTTAIPATSTPTITAVPATSTPTTASSPTATRTMAPSATATSTNVPSKTATNTMAPATSTPTTASSPTSTKTTAPSATSTSTNVPSRTATTTPVPATGTSTTAPSATATRAASSSATATATAAASVTTTPTSTATATTAPSATNTATATTAPSATATNTSTATATSTNTATATATMATPSATAYPTIIVSTTTPTARPTLGLSVRVHPRIVVNDHFLSVRVHTQPGATVSVTFQVPAATGQPASHVVVKPGAGHPVSSRTRHVSGRSAPNSHAGQPRRQASRGYAVTHNGVANAHGFYVTYFYVTYKSATPALALVTVTARTRRASATRHVYIVVLPTRRIARSG